MQPEHASRTALSAAAHRAAHQLLEHGAIFADSLALSILGADCDRLARESAERPDSRHVVFDYGDPPQTLAPEERAAYEQHAHRVAELGEPWVSFFEPAELHARLGAMGFREIEDIMATELVGRYVSLAQSSSRRRGAHVLRATNI